MGDLNVQERRRRTRILTLRNTAWVALIAVSSFLAISLWNELHPKSEDGLALLDARKQKVEDPVVEEVEPWVPPTDVTAREPAQPVWVEKPGAEEILGVDPYPYRFSEPSDIRLGTGTELAPAQSFRGGENAFLEQRTARGRARVKITGVGSAVQIEKE